MKLYRISRWSEIFENNRSRTIGKLSWVAVPNHHDGEHFSAIMQHPDGAMIYAAWMLVVQVASRCLPRGVLVRPDGTPLTPESLSLKTRAPVIWFEKSLQFLEHHTDWIEVEEVATEGQFGVIAASGERQDSAPRARARNRKDRTEQDGIERKEQDAATLCVVEAIYQAYPLKVGKVPALKSISKAILKIPAEELLKKVQAFNAVRNGNLDYCPHPATWFNQERYNDDPSTWVRVNTNERTRDEGHSERRNSVIYH